MVQIEDHSNFFIFGFWDIKAVLEINNLKNWPGFSGITIWEKIIKGSFNPIRMSKIFVIRGTSEIEERYWNKLYDHLNNFLHCYKFDKNLSGYIAIRDYLRQSSKNIRRNIWLKKFQNRVR